MIKRILSAFISLICFLLCTITVFASDLDNSGEKLIVGVPADRCPVFYIEDETGEVTGIGVDIMRHVAEKAGFSATFVNIREADLKQALDNEDYDVVMPFGSAITSSSGQSIIVSDSIMQTPFTLVTVASQNLTEINHIKVGMVRSLGGVAETISTMYPGIEIVFYDSMGESVKALRSSQVDALLNNTYVWSYVLQKPSYADLKVQPTSILSMEFKAGTLDTEKGREIIERLNEGIKDFSDKSRQAIVLDYSSRRLYKYSFFDTIYQFRFLIAIASAMFAFVMAVFIQKHHIVQKEQEEKLREVLDRDPLTGALSHQGFKKRVEVLLKENPDIPYHLSFSNIKNFKFINDSYGRETGDEILRFWVKKSMESFSQYEAIGRITADHIVVLRTVRGDEQMMMDERRVFNPLRNFLTDRGINIKIQLCTGIYVVTPQDYQRIDVDRMIDFARVAENRVSENVKDGYEFYNPDEWKKEKQSLEICGHLQSAIQAGEIVVWYQPQVDYETGEIVGAEALCRWNHARLGWISPDSFIPILENAGLIYTLDSFIWESVCKDLKKWNDKGEHRSISVNLSRSDLRNDRNISAQFYNLVKRYDLSFDQLRIEITENAFADNAESLIDTIIKLKEFGFRVEMDDFGSGYSSLHMLKEVPVDRIKMDLHFLRGDGDSEKGRIVISHIIRMVNELGMSIIAEGVETDEQAAFLKNEGCSEMQGYYFYKPMPVEEFEKMEIK